MLITTAAAVVNCYSFSTAALGGFFLFFFFFFSVFSFFFFFLLLFLKAFVCVFLLSVFIFMSMNFSDCYGLLQASEICVCYSVCIVYTVHRAEYVDCSHTKS